MSKDMTWWSVSGIVYPESGNIESVLGYLSSHGLNGYCSPLHLSDEKEKKEHYHVNIVRPPKSGLSLTRWQRYFKDAGLANGFVKTNDYPVKAAKYLLHLENPEKQQFPNYEVHNFESEYSTANPVLKEFGNPIPYNEFILMSDDIKKINPQSDSIYKLVIKWINENNCLNYASLLNYSISCQPLWVDIVRKNCNNIISYMRSVEYAHGVGGSKRDAYSDAQERKVVKLLTGRANDETLSSIDIDIIFALEDDGFLYGS